MTEHKSATSNIVALLAILALSSVTMLWLFWRFPIVTGLITVALMLAFGFSARTARSLDTDMGEMDHSETIVG